jgi:hypothetical protein
MSLFGHCLTIVGRREIAAYRSKLAEAEVGELFD